MSRPMEPHLLQQSDVMWNIGLGCIASKCYRTQLPRSLTLEIHSINRLSTNAIRTLCSRTVGCNQTGITFSLTFNRMCLEIEALDITQPARYELEHRYHPAEQ
jgi:hypothetical protein